MRVFIAVTVQMSWSSRLWTIATMTKVGGAMTAEREAMMLERQAFEKWYAANAFTYFRDPIGSRDCSLQWEAWQAALSYAAEPVYQYRGWNGDWCDCSKNVFDGAHPELRRILYTHPPEPARDAKRDQRMFIEGWRAAAEWANRWDLISDVDSPAWITRFDAAMAQESGE